MLISSIVSAILVSVCIYVHFRAMRTLAMVIDREHPPVHRPLLLVFFSLFVVHLFEVLLYAIALSVLDQAGLGSLQGARSTELGYFYDHFYFSIASYTSLGLGDIVPHGEMRLVAGVEALNGLVLIAWTASFSYLMMERFWGGNSPGRFDDN